MATGKRASSRKSSNQRTTPPLGVLFWIACILLILIVFLITRQNIQRVLENTQLIEVITQQDSERQRPGLSEQPSDSTNGQETTRPTDVPTNEPVTRPPSTPEGQPVLQPDPPSGTPTAPETPPSQPTEPPATTQVPDPDPEPQARVRTFPLYFVRVTDSGDVVLEGLPRGIRFVDSPLTATLQALLAGPVREETNKGFMSLIPENSQLISASIRGNTAYLNFNEAFRFNPMGLEGQRAQIQQIIYTATEFPTVHNVQFMIQGQVVNYLGGDGLFVGIPLQRGSI
jgi:germination protein M